MGTKEVKEKFQMKQWVRDMIYGIVIVIFSIANIIYGRSLPVGSVQLRVAQAGFYLEIVCIAFAALGLALIIRSLVKKPDEVCQPLFTKPTVVTLAIMIIFLLALKKIGFAISSFLLVFSLSCYYGYVMGKLGSDRKTIAKHILYYALYAVIITGVSYLLFSKLMGVLLPKFTLF